ncbi:MAG: hypothetical protein PUH25_02820 [Spirochaetales bacterium]|nr:hypothetical protein [Spirochaetales bacterium]
MKKIYKLLTMILLVLSLVSCLAPHLIIYDQAINNRSLKINIGTVWGRELYCINANAGDQLRVYYEVTDGLVILEIKDPNSNVIYKGNGQEVSKFKLRLTDSGKYSILVKSFGANGFVYIDREEKEK